VIEAKWLFGLKTEQIEVVVHPQSIIHSLVQFEDGSIKAQLGLPDMRIPIQFALSYPYRLKSDFERFNFANYPSLTFEQPDMKTFRNLQLAFDALGAGGNAPCVLNAANEIAVAAFLNRQVGFLEMSDLIEETLAKATFVKHPSLEDYVASDLEARTITENLIKSKV
jgi:1-deoxy-D-xylulose-5-phosphate reductoisomerase